MSPDRWAIPPPLTPVRRGLVRWSGRLYRLLLVAYPPGFRRRYGGEMRRLFDARCRDAMARGAAPAALLWLQTLRDIVVNATGEWRAAVRARRHPEPELYPFAPRRKRTAGDHMRAVPRDLRVAARSLRRSPGFAAVAALTLAVGMGATVTIFSLVNGVLLRPLPYPDADRLVALQHRAPGLASGEVGQSSGTYYHYRRRAGSFEDMGLYVENVVNLTGEGEPERVSVALGTGSVFTTLGVVPAHGRLLTDADAQQGAGPVVMISHRLWTRRFDADPAAVGGEIRLNSRAFEIVGVLPEGFEFPRPETEVWYALEMYESAASFQGLDLPAIARLAPGATPARAEAELRTLIPGLVEAYDDATPELIAQLGLDPLVRPLHDEIVGEAATALWFLMATVGLVLLIACANVANLFLVRAEFRQREVAVRRALGASGLDVARTWLGESLLVAAAGGATGLLLAAWSVTTLVSLGPGEIPRLHEVGLDATVVAFALALVAGACLLLAAVPLLRHSGSGMAAALKEGGRGAGPGAARQHAGRALVVAQVATALTLLVASALMARSSWELARVDPGFEADGVLTFEVALPFGRYPTYGDSAGFFRDALERIRALPGVVSAGAGSHLPLTEFSATGRLDTIVTGEDLARPDARVHGVRMQVVTPGYFEAMRIPLVEGRLPRFTDDASGRPVVVSAALARRLGGPEGVLGRNVRREPSAGELRYLESEGQPVEWNTVVGVVGDVLHESLTGSPAAIVYLPVLERPVDIFTPSHMSGVVRAAVPPLGLAADVRRAIRSVDPDMPVANVRTLEQIVASSTARSRFTMLLLALAAILALFLGAVGLYAVISYAVSRRTHEIGVRIALGAGVGDVTRMVVGQGAAVAAAGVVVGLLGAFGLTRFLESMLFEVSGTDPATYAATALALLAVALLASWVPARTAARVDPLQALRAE